MLRRLACALAALVLLAAPAAAQTTVACERCHGSREFLTQAAGGAQVGDSLVVVRSALARDKHIGVPCVGCHTQAAAFPHAPARRGW